VSTSATTNTRLDKQQVAGRNLANSRNGRRSKTVVTGTGGEVDLEVPRDRDGTFEPVTIRKRQRRVSDAAGAVVVGCDRSSESQNVVVAATREASRGSVDPRAAEGRRSVCFADAVCGEGSRCCSSASRSPSLRSIATWHRSGWTSTAGWTRGCCVSTVSGRHPRVGGPPRALEPDPRVPP
jgi:hypothetical protein